ncbi:LAFE_0B11078g1_1 [Lachancea fermentati]|uniref:Guanosine-diphosphatase n=1 Tax=Lachancea fermentati TaxID=4955 RepID=A0A1G4M8N8_LACFM|nr:LAFE_0B11078g1_1 [Lachancea fermentati]
MVGIGSIIRNYRFLIGSFTAVMLILLLRSSNSGEFKKANLPSLTEADGSQDFNTLPVGGPGYLEDTKTEKGNPSVANEVKNGSKGEASSDALKGYSTGKKCDKEHQFVVMIDAGSTGSRVHVYEFDVCTQPPTLLDETFEKVTPGLSHFDIDAVGAAKSLDGLLDTAVKKIPLKLRGCSPVAVKATAGLRKLGEEKSEAILKAVRKHLEEDYPFPVVEEDGISVMSGEEEGVYAWITTNFLLGNIGAGEKLPTSAIFDLGGGSTQIVFEPSFPPNERMIEGEHKYDLDFGEAKYTLYQYSHLGYGLMEARNSVNAAILETAIKDGKIEKTDYAPVKEIESPCLPPGTKAAKEVVTLANNKKYTVTFKGPSTATGPALCRSLAEKILKKDAECTNPPCSFNGIHQPSLVRTFKESNDLYIFSYFYDKTQPLGMPSSFTLQELTELARLVCSGEDVWKSVFSAVDGSLDELLKEPQWCLDLSFEVALLHTGYDIPLQRELRTAQTIKGNEIGWCLGASLPLLESTNWKCKVTEAL